MPRRRKAQHPEPVSLPEPARIEPPADTTLLVLLLPAVAGAAGAQKILGKEIAAAVVPQECSPTGEGPASHWFCVARVPDADVPAAVLAQPHVSGSVLERWDEPAVSTDAAAAWLAARGLVFLPLPAAPLPEAELRIEVGP